MKSILLVTCTIIITMLLLKNKSKFMAIQNQHHHEITNEHLHEHLLKILNELAEIKKMIIEDRDNVSQHSLTRLKLIVRHLTKMSE